VSEHPSNLPDVAQSVMLMDFPQGTIDGKEQETMDARLLTLKPVERFGPH
jgi:hypothetical protein